VIQLLPFFLLFIVYSTYNMDKRGQETERSVLMNALIADEPFSHIKDLLEKGADPNVRAYDDCYARDFNLIYCQKKIQDTLAPIVDRMLMIESNNRLYPQEKLCLICNLSAMPEAEKTRNALAIEAIFEFKGAKSRICESDQPLFNLIKSEPILRRLFCYLYEPLLKKNDQICILPKNIYQYLKNPPQDF
jgi:hypothetical protein